MRTSLTLLLCVLLINSQAHCMFSSSASQESKHAATANLGFNPQANINIILPQPPVEPSELSVDLFQNHTYPQTDLAWPFFDELVKKLPQDADILNIGCTANHLCERGAAHYPRKFFIGIDAWDKVIRKQQKLNTYLNAAFETMNINNIALAANSVDSALCFSTLGYYPYNRQQIALQNIIRVLKPGGHGLITAPSKPLSEDQNPLFIVALMLTGQQEPWKQYLNQLIMNPVQVYQHTETSMRELIHNAGGADIATKTIAWSWEFETPQALSKWVAAWSDRVQVLATIEPIKRLNFIEATVGTYLEILRQKGLWNPGEKIPYLMPGIVAHFKKPAAYIEA